MTKWMILAGLVIGSCAVVGNLQGEPTSLGQDSAAKELARLQGEWSMVSGAGGGQPMPPEQVKGAKRLAKGNETTIIVGGVVFFKANITIDPTKQPKTIDYAMTDDDDYQYPCNCGFSKCRGVVSGKDWMQKELQKKYRGYFSAYREKRMKMTSPHKQLLKKSL